MTTLFVVRHGESVWNADGVIQGQRDAPGLTDLGRAQAAEAAESLAAHGVWSLWCSDATRAVETAAIIGERLGLRAQSTALLRERHWGSLQGAAKSEALPLERTLADDEPLPGGGESRNELEQRVLEFVGSVAEPAIVVTHGDVLAAIGRRWGAPVNEDNGSITRVDL